MKKTATEVTHDKGPVKRLVLEPAKMLNGDVGFVFELLPFGGKVIATLDDVESVFAQLVKSVTLTS